MTRSYLFIKACSLVLAVAGANNDNDTCAASPGGCAWKNEADANTLIQSRVRISGGLAPDLKAEEQYTKTAQVLAPTSDRDRKATKWSPTLLPAIDLGTAGGFALLTKTGVTTTGVTSVTGNMGTSPIAATAMTGFALTLDASTEFSTSNLVHGRVYAASYAAPTPAMMTAAISDMETAYNDAAGRVDPDTTELGAGIIEGMSPQGGLHKWSSSVTFSESLSFDAGGNPDTVWILQIAQSLVLGTGARVTLKNGAKASNIFWQVAGEAKILAGAHAEGIILCKTAIIFGSEASLNGRGLAQTAVTMIATTIVEAPGPWTAMNPDPSKLVWDTTPVPGKNVTGTLTSRLDPFDEDSPFIKVKVLMRFAGVQPAALGPLLGHCGGPGSGKWCGVNLYSQLGPSPDLQDYWGIDQRGIAESKPRIGCEGEVFKTPAANKSKYVVSDFTDCPCRVPDDVPEIVQTTVDGAQTYFEKIAPRFHGACYTMSKYQLVGANNKTYNFLNYVGTRALAHDIDTFRQAIGAPKMNIYGISYGTYVGGVYASMYPEYTNRVVINGNMDPMPDGVVDAAGVVHAYSTSVAKLLRNCDQSPKCDYFRKGNNTAWEGYTKVLNRMMAGYYKGKTDKGNDFVLPAVAMISFILNSMYDASGAGWQEAIQTLAAFYDDSNQTGQQHATDQFLDQNCRAGGVETWKKYEVCVSQWDLGGGGSFDLEAVFGVDFAGRYTPWQAARRWRSVRSEFGDFAGWLFMRTLGPYTNYPATPAPPAPLGNPDVPVLVVGTLYDPITAYHTAQKMHGSFPSGSLMTWQGVGHGMVCDAKYDPGMGDCQCSELIRKFLATGVMPQNGYLCRSNARLPTRLLSK